MAKTGHLFINIGACMSEFDESNELFKGLKALSEASFPKRCASCGNVFHTAEEFFIMTAPLKNSSGLKETEDFDDKKIVELFRNCSCGSTLMDEFHNRRDDSEAGKRRREIFEKTLVILLKDGLPREDGRLEILRFMRGEKSQVIDRLLIKKRPVKNSCDSNP